ncbi:unnamed protein product [Lupinus luteus]|uniref:Uncharacterized protein n=1 Tax=Lupinus luteus TaxID=3873 RepID=A0AAV1XX67_LUPLU
MEHFYDICAATRELRIACTMAQMERDGGISPRVRDAGNLLTRAAFTLPSVDVEEYIVKYESGESFHSVLYIKLFHIFDINA